MSENVSVFIMAMSLLSLIVICNYFPTVDTDDSVPGVLYDLLQKEVLALRKAGHEKDQSLKDKDDAIEVSIFLFLDINLRFLIDNYNLS